MSKKDRTETAAAMRAVFTWKLKYCKGPFKMAGSQWKLDFTVS